MRRLLAPLTRWLDRRIDVRIAACRRRETLPAGLQRLADAAAADMRAARVIFEDASDSRRGGNWMGA